MNIIKVLLIAGLPALASGFGGYFVAASTISVECKPSAEQVAADAKAAEWMKTRPHSFRPWIGR